MIKSGSQNIKNITKYIGVDASQYQKGIKVFVSNSDMIITGRG
jgi:hypothetical protein